MTRGCWPGGLPVPGLAVRIVDPSSLEDVSFGEEGELIVRGPNLMQGYHNKPAETAVALRKGWYHTGDLARSDPSGYLTITGRIKELIIRGGVNISPVEIDGFLMQRPELIEVATVGVPDAVYGEEVVSYVVARQGVSIDIEDLLRYCGTVLPAFKAPKQIVVSLSLPKNERGKLDRRALAKRWSEDAN